MLQLCCVCSFVCSSTCMCGCMCIESRGQLRMSFFRLRWGSLISRECLRLARCPGLGAPGSCQSHPLQHLGCVVSHLPFHMLSPLFFVWTLATQLSFLCLHGRHLISRVSPQTLNFSLNKLYMSGGVYYKNTCHFNVN